MRFSRTILALVIALSVAALPFAYAGAATVQSVQMTDSGTADDCCAHEPPCDTKATPLKNCAAMAACAVICFGYAGPAVAGATLGSIGAVLNPIRAETPHLSQPGSPPFRPPRV